MVVLRSGRNTRVPARYAMPGTAAPDPAMQALINAQFHRGQAPIPDRTLDQIRRSQQLRQAAATAARRGAGRSVIPPPLSGQIALPPAAAARRRNEMIAGGLLLGGGAAYLGRKLYKRLRPDKAAPVAA